MKMNIEMIASFFFLFLATPGSLWEPGIESVFPEEECRILTAGLPGKSHLRFFNVYFRWAFRYLLINIVIVFLYSKQGNNLETCFSINTQWYFWFWCGLISECLQIITEVDICYTYLNIQIFKYISY